MHRTVEKTIQYHRHLMLKLDKQINATIYRPILAVNEAREHSPLGKHHCTAGLQFYKVALDCFTKYK